MFTYLKNVMCLAYKIKEFEFWRPRLIAQTWNAVRFSGLKVGSIRKTKSNKKDAKTRKIVFKLG